MKKPHLFSLIIGFAALLLVCLSQFLVITPNVAQPAAKLTVSAAISLTEALQDVKQLYGRSRPSVALTYNFGSSGALQQQIEQGAPVDVFISAATKQMDALQAKNLLLPDTRRNLLTNQLVLVTPLGVRTITSFKDLTRSQIKRIALGEPKSVPAGQYGAQVLNFYGVAEQIKPKLIYAKDVRQVLTYVETGNVDAGLVYLTDARSSNQVRIAAIAPESSHTPIVYPVAVVRDTKNLSAARAFVQFLFSRQAQSVFTKYGFKSALKS